MISTVQDRPIQSIETCQALAGNFLVSALPRHTSPALLLHPCILPPLYLLPYVSTTSTYSSYSNTDALPHMPLPMSVPATPPRRQGHRRSFSNPFAGIGNRRKSPAKRQHQHVFGVSDSDDDDDGDVTIPLPEVSGTSPRKPLPPPPDETATGRCMTCNSTMRWPRNLEVFRCTACLTVNDLEPAREETRHGKASAPRAIPRKGMDYLLYLTFVWNGY